MKHRRNRGLTAVEFLVVIVVVGIAAAVTVPAVLRMGRNDRLAKCDANLRALWNLDAEARAKGKAPTEKGSQYWAALVTSMSANPALLTCPLSGRPYRGPASDLSQFPAGFPMGADPVGSHGEKEGGHILFKDGKVHAVRELDSLWRAAAQRLGP